MEDNESHRGFFAALLVLLALAAGWVYLVSDEDRFAALSKGADAILNRVLPE
jgi:hypothetical protein